MNDPKAKSPVHMADQDRVIRQVARVQPHSFDSDVISMSETSNDSGEDSDTKLDLIIVELTISAFAEEVMTKAEKLEIRLPEEKNKAKINQSAGTGSESRVSTLREKQREDDEIDRESRSKLAKNGSGSDGSGKRKDDNPEKYESNDDDDEMNGGGRRRLRHPQGARGGREHPQGL